MITLIIYLILIFCYMAMSWALYQMYLDSTLKEFHPIHIIIVFILAPIIISVGFSIVIYPIINDFFNKLKQ